MTRSKEEIDKILHRARKGKLTFLYITPERLQNHVFIEAIQHSDIFYDRGGRVSLHYGMGLYVS